MNDYTTINYNYKINSASNFYDDCWTGLNLCIDGIEHNENDTELEDTQLIDIKELLNGVSIGWI